ncbi:MAG: bifunctional 2-polyprenyl-6-hydroxyphenol methylase/3-demethylubiquinol 3-O-methyltransferase UbiG [Alphaproteobacteria bacterium]|nr:bifunctional 2-polyprenyl-6-hydroxyphenol methylase/3-demethylubiquinol 3-O-methyltransferase UbiG [Alphaproteobacteria bacterium]
MNTVNLKEIQNFSKDSAYWWDIDGPFRPLHRLNPIRLGYIKSQICSHFDRDLNSLNTYEGLKILDIGCGGGLVCEPMARLGGIVSGIDADTNAIEVAKDHAKNSGLEIEYHATSSDELVKTGKKYDVVLALEIIEHVDNQDLFVKNVMDLCKPGGLIIFSTLNRNPKSFALGIMAAEYILGWVPKGTHDWKKFIKPSELSRMISHHGGNPQDLCGLAFNPIKNDFHLAPKDLDVNYFLSSVRS